MKRIVLLLVAVSLLALAGCTTTGLDPQDATISIKDDTLYAHIYLTDDVQKNDEDCTTIVVGGTPQTQCHNDWKSVDISSEASVSRQW